MKKKIFQKDYIWAFTTYFTEGFPFTIIRTVSAVFFRDLKVSLEAIGLTSLFGLPWILKFLWGPQVDEYGTKRKWMLGMQSMLLVMMVLAAFFVPLDNNVQLIAALFFIGSFIAATHDTAIDGYYMEALDKAGQAKFVGYRVMAYRSAMMTGTGLIVTLGTTVNWALAFLSAAIVFGLFFFFHLFFLKEVEVEKKRIIELVFRGFRVKPFVLVLAMVSAVIGIRHFFQSPYYLSLKEQFPILKKIYFSHWVALLLLLALIMVGLLRNKLKALVLKDPDSYYGKAFIYFMERDKIGIILFFIIFLRMGEWTLSTMVSPFMVDLGIKMHYGWMSAGVGLPASIVGALLGGWMISRFTLKRVIWPFIFAQNFTNIIYMGLAIHLSTFIKLNTDAAEPVSLGISNLALVASVHAFDQFAGGLGTAVLMTFLMRVCHREYKAAHYAIGSGLMNLSGLFAGVMSGFIAGWLGYAWLFGLSFVASIPAMAVIPLLPYLTETSKKTLAT
ncbi:MAG: AmpG family muropeptide MFS transporter [bacterium]|nr:AmpG family muropeptide MFS transporter [bacterium]